MAQWPQVIKPSVQEEIQTALASPLRHPVVRALLLTSGITRMALLPARVVQALQVGH